MPAKSFANSLTESLTQKSPAKKSSIKKTVNKSENKSINKSINKSEKIIVTAALPYANGSIHIGHLLEYIQADIFSRFLKLTGKNALYICASDMHGTPIEVNASKAGKKPEQFALEFWKEHQEDFASYLIHFDNYYKTHSPENKELAEYFYKELKKKDLVYTKDIKIVYCEHCKRSLPDRFVKGICPKCQAADQYGDVCEQCSSVIKGIELINPHCVICKNKPVHKESKHYFFKLSSFSKELAVWIMSKKADLQPEVKNWLENWIKAGLEDWCISRDAPYFGFEIPESKKETGETKYFYVWLDAPIGYISSTKNYCDKHLENKRQEKWEDYWKKGQVYHIIGKDIAYFHFLFWPAMLMAVDIPVPKLTVHGFITVDGQKMSKSRGTFFTAKDFLKLYPAEALRFYYASHLDRKVADVDLNLQDFQAFNNNVLVGNIGNFCYRVLTFAQKNYGEIKEIADEKELTKQIEQKVKEIEKYYAEQDFRLAVKEILQIADIGNSYFQNQEPWKNKESKKAEVAWCVNIARNLAIIVSPILPKFSEKVAKVFAEKGTELDWKQIGFKWKGKLHPVELLVQKIETIQEKNFPLQMRVGEIQEVKNHPNADSLYLFKVDFGDGVKQVVAGLKKYFTPEQLTGRKTIFCTNLKPSKLRGEMSEAMTMVAEDSDHKIALLETTSLTGTEARFGDLVNNAKEIGYDEFTKLKMTILKGKVFFDRKVLACNGEEVLAKGVKDGAGIV